MPPRRLARHLGESEGPGRRPPLGESAAAAPVSDSRDDKPYLFRPRESPRAQDFRNRPVGAHSIEVPLGNAHVAVGRAEAGPTFPPLASPFRERDAGRRFALRRGSVTLKAHHPTPPCRSPAAAVAPRLPQWRPHPALSPPPLLLLPPPPPPPSDRARPIACAVPPPRVPWPAPDPLSRSSRH